MANKMFGYEAYQRENWRKSFLSFFLSFSLSLSLSLSLYYGENNQLYSMRELHLLAD